MTIEPGTYTAVLPADMDRMGSAQKLLNDAGGKLEDWGLNDNDGIDVRFTTTKPVQWPADLPPPVSVSQPQKATAAIQTVKTQPAKKKRRPKKADAGMSPIVWFFLLKMMGL